MAGVSPMWKQGYMDSREGANNGYPRFPENTDYMEGRAKEEEDALESTQALKVADLLDQIEGAVSLAGTMGAHRFMADIRDVCSAHPFYTEGLRQQDIARGLGDGEDEFPYLLEGE